MVHPVCNIHKKPTDNISQWPNSIISGTDQLTLCLCEHFAIKTYDTSYNACTIPIKILMIFKEKWKL